MSNRGVALRDKWTSKPA